MLLIYYCNPLSPERCSYFLTEPVRGGLNIGFTSKSKFFLLKSYLKMEFSL